jgi:tetratricopeptide (TPR) repeat protein
MEGRALQLAAMLHMDSREYRTAKRVLREALSVHRACQYKRGEAEALSLLASVHHSNAKWRLAEKCYRGALRCHRAAKDRRGEAITFMNLGLMLREMGRSDEGERVLAESLAMHRQVQNRRFEGVALINIAEKELFSGEHRQALGRLASAAAVLHSVGDHESECYARMSMAEAALRDGRLECAHVALSDALNTATPARLHEIHGAWMLLMLLLGHESEAATHFAQARSAWGDSPLEYMNVLSLRLQLARAADAAALARFVEDTQLALEAASARTYAGIPTDVLVAPQGICAATLKPALRACRAGTKQPLVLGGFAVAELAAPLRHALLTYFEARTPQLPGQWRKRHPELLAALMNGLPQTPHSTWSEPCPVPR